MNYANCLKGQYHYFKVVSSPYMIGRPSVNQIEVCRYCGKREEYAFLPNGKMVDEKKYFFDHIRAFCQPSMGDVYYECNPGAKEKFAAEEVAKKKSEIFQLESSDKFKFAIKRALEDKGWKDGKRSSREK